MGKRMQTGDEEKSFPPEKIMLRLCLCLSFVNLPNQNRAPALNVIFISTYPTILSAYSTSSFRKGIEQFVFWIINEISILPGCLRFVSLLSFSSLELVWNSSQSIPNDDRWSIRWRSTSKTYRYFSGRVARLNIVVGFSCENWNVGNSKARV